GGAARALVRVVPLILSRPLNGLSYEDLAAGEILSVVTGCVYYVVGAITIALFAQTLNRSAGGLRRGEEGGRRCASTSARPGSPSARRCRARSTTPSCRRSRS